MNIITENRIFEKYFKSVSEKFLRDPKMITEIVLHGTGGGQSAQAIINWMLNGEREEEYKKGIALFHYEIDRNGNIYQILDDKYWCYHSSSGRHDEKTIGIELVNPRTYNLGEYTIDQYDSLFALLKKFIYFYKIKTIVGHGANKIKYSGTYKECPGKFDWNLLCNNFTLERIDNESYQVKTE